MIFEWKILEMNFGAKLYLGKYHVGSVFWDDKPPSEDKCKYKVRCLLPGVRQGLGRFETMEEGKAKLAGAVNIWILGAMGEL